MGQKVQPLGFRRSAYKKNLGLSSMYIPETVTAGTVGTAGTGENNKTKPSQLTLSFLRGSFDYGPRPVKGQISYSKKLHEDFVIEGIVEEFFKKSGYIVTKLFINKNFKELQITVGIFKPLEPIKTPVANKEKTGKAFPHEMLSSLDLEIDVLTKFLEKLVSTKVSINREILTFSKGSVASHTSVGVNNVSVNSEENRSTNVGDKEVLKELQRLVLTKNGKTLPFESNAVITSINILSKALKNYRKEFFFKNGLTVLALFFLRPNATLLAKYMALTLDDLPKGQTFIDFIGYGLGALFQNQQTFEGSTQQENVKNLPTLLMGERAKIKGILVKVKGRINGSDRSRIATYRFGSIPLHTIKAAIDYSFTFTKCSYGVSSIKVWLFVEP
jgi:hypothetical protein